MYVTMVTYITISVLPVCCGDKMQVCCHGNKHHHGSVAHGDGSHCRCVTMETETIMMCYYGNKSHR